jgi:hypothetical protein
VIVDQRSRITESLCLGHCFGPSGSFERAGAVCLRPRGRKSCLLATILMARLQPALVIFERPPEGFFATSSRGIFPAFDHVGPEGRG